MARYNIEIKLNAGRTAGTLDRISKALDSLSSSADKAGASVNTVDFSRFQRGSRGASDNAARASAGFSSFGRSALNVHRAISLIAFGVVTRELKQLAEAALNAARDWERMANTMRAVTGNQESASKEIKSITSLSKELGLNLRTAAGDFAKFSAAARGTALEGAVARDIFEKVSRSITVLGLDADRSHLVFLALQQMMSKGTVQSEELRRQLGEHLPGAFQLAARAMGVTTQEFNKMLKRGEVMAEDLLPKLAAELEGAFGGEVTNASQSLNATFNRMQTSIFEISRMIGDELSPKFKELVGWLSEFADSGKAEVAISKISAAFSLLGQSMAALFPPLILIKSGLREAIDMLGNSPSRIIPAAESIRTLEIEFESLQQSIFRLQDKLDPVTQRMDALTKSGQSSGSEFKALSERANQLTGEIDKLKSEQSSAREEMDKFRKASEKAEDSSKDFDERLISMRATLAGLKEGQRNVNVSTKEGSALHGDYAVAIAELTQRLSEFTAARAIVSEDEKWLKSVQDSIAENNALADALERGIEEYNLMKVAIEAQMEVKDGLNNREREYADLLRVSNERAAEAARIAKEAASFFDDSSKDDIDRFGADLQSMQETEDALAEIDRAATLAHNKELKIRLDADLEYMRRRVRELKHMLRDQERGERQLSRVLVDVLKDSADQFSDLDKNVAVFVDSLADVVAAFQRVREAAEDATQAERDAANVGAAVAISGAVASIGNQVTGGQNYAGIASVAGMAIGAALAAAFTGGMGAGAGAAIGGAAGSAVGSFMKKGADEFLANVQQLIGGVITTMPTKIQGEMGQIGLEFAHAIEEGIEGALDSLGGSIEELPGISIKVREGVFSVFTAGMVKRFDNMGAAVDFAILAALKQGDLDGVSENVKLAIENSVGQSFREMSVDIDFAKMVDNLPGIGEAASESARLINDAVDLFRRNIKHAQELGIGIAELEQQFGRDSRSLRNSILGIVETDEERIRREASAFNREVELLRAQESIKAAEINMKIEALKASAELFKLEGHLAENTIVLRELELQTQWDILGSEMSLYQRRLEAQNEYLGSLAYITDQIAALANLAAQSAAIIAGLPDLISDSEIQNAINNAGGGGRGRGGSGRPAGPTVADEIESLMDVIDQLVRSGLSPFHQSLLTILDTFEKHLETARRLEKGEEELIKLRQQAIDQLKEQQIIDPLREFLGPNAIEGGQFGMSDFDKEAADIRARFDAIREANQALIDEGEERAIAFWKINAAELRALQALAEKVVDTLGLPLEGTRDRVKEMKDALDFLRDSLEAGAIDADRFGDVFGQLSNQVSAEMLDMFAGILDQMGETEEAARLRAKLAKLQFVIEITQLRILFDAYAAMGLIIGELKEELGALLAFIEDPANWPDFTIPQGDVGGVGGGGGSTEGRRPAQFDNDLLDRLQQQIDDWMRLGIDPLILQARDMRKAYEDLVEEGRLLRVSTEKLSEAFAHAVDVFVDDALSPFENLGETALQREFRELQERLEIIRQAFVEIGASADDMQRLEAASAAAMADFWSRATSGIQGLMEEITGILEGPATRENLASEMMNLQDLVSRAQSGDLSALAEIEASGRSLLDLIEQVYGGGRAGSDLRAQLLELLGMAVDGSVYGVNAQSMSTESVERERQTLSETRAMRQHLEMLRSESRSQSGQMVELVQSIDRRLAGRDLSPVGNAAMSAAQNNIRLTA